MIANAVAPAGETDFLADMAVAEFSAVVRTVAMHFAVFLLKEKAGRMLRPGRWRGKAHGRALLSDRRLAVLNTLREAPHRVRGGATSSRGPRA